MVAERCVIFCATQRTGSTMMFDDLLNIVGRWPADCEILRNSLFYEDAARSFPMKDWESAWANLCVHNQVQGMVVHKVMFHYSAYFSAAIRGVLPKRRPPILSFTPESFDAFHDFFRDAIWVLVDRRDVYAQAVSMYFAEATNTWENRAPLTAPSIDYSQRVAYDRTRLLEIFRGFMTERAQWPRFFEHYGIVPLRLAYEDAVTNYPVYLDELVRTAGLTPVFPCPPRRLAKQGDATNEIFARRLRDDVLLETYARRAGATRTS